MKGAGKHLAAGLASGQGAGNHRVKYAPDKKKGKHGEKKRCLRAFNQTDSCHDRIFINARSAVSSALWFQTEMSQHVSGRLP